MQPMRPDERAFFQALGARIAQARKAVGLTQVQLAERLGIPQPQLASYEVGRRRVPASMLLPLARALAIQVEALIGDDEARAQPAREPATPASEAAFAAIWSNPEDTAYDDL